MHHVEADVPATERLIQEEHRTYSPSLGEPRPRSRRSKEEDVEEEDDEKHVLKPTWFIWMLVVAAGVSGLLFGYDTGVISSMLVSIRSDLSSRNLTTLDKSLITSATSLFALVASPITGHLADTLGRKRVIFIASVLFVIGALWQAVCTTVWEMIVGRSIVGLAVGSASFVVPLYIGELSPSRFRGQLVTVASLFITGGQVIAYIVGWGFSTTSGGWRWMVGLGALPAAIQLMMLAALPETPRWLVQAGRREEAARVLTKVYGHGDGMHIVVEKVLDRVKEEQEVEEEATRGRSDEALAGGRQRSKFFNDHFVDLFTIGGNRRALIIACMLQGFQQLCGFNSLMYFSATIFALVGFTSPTLASLSIAITNFIFTFVAFRSIDRVGRRRILLLSMPFMVLGLALCALAFKFLDIHTTSSALVKPRNSISGSDIQTSTPTNLWTITLLLSLVLYVSAYALGLGNVPWQQSELFPLSVRSVGSGLATATNWGSNTIVGLTFLPMMEFFTPTWTFLTYAGVCVVAWVSVWWCYPETAGLGLEEVGGLLSEGWGVDESKRKWEVRKRGRRAVVVAEEDVEL